MNKEFKDWLEEKKRNSTYSYLNNGKLINPNPDIEKELDIVIKKYDELHKLPVIPKYVAEWIEEEQGAMSNWKLPSRFISDSKYKKDQRRYKWSQVEGNMDKFMSALINGYEVEQEPLYCAMVKGHELLDDTAKYWAHNKYDSEDLFISYETRDDSPIIVKNTKSRWNDLGVNDSNADFVRVEGVIE